MTKAKVAVAYHTSSGTTGQLAVAVAEGIEQVAGIEANPAEIVSTDIHAGRYANQDMLKTLSEADGVVFGSPTFMGCVSAQFKAFADATGELWADQQWSGKVAAGFTIGSNLSGDQLNTIQYLHIFASQHGMLWTSLDIPGGSDGGGRNRLGSQSGLIAQTSDGVVNERDLETARHLGARVARLARLIGSSDHRI